MASATLEYLSVGCNRTPHCVDWNRNGLLAYGADRSIALATETTPGCGPDKVVAMLNGHSDRVNCVRWVSPRSGHAQYTQEHRTAVELISGSVDKHVITWKKSGNAIVKNQVLTGHTGSVTCVAAISFLCDGPLINTLIASGSADSSVNIWERIGPSDQFSLIQTLPFGRGFVLGLVFFELPGIKGQPILACGGDDTKIHLFTKQNGQFVRVLSLTGHEDWVRDVSFTQENGGDLLLASCSQDAYIRLWRISKEAESTDEATPTTDQAPVPKELKLTSNIFSISEGSKFKVTVESVLIGHEDWVYSVQWQPLQLEPTITQPLCLLSASMDKTMLLWKPDPVSGVWMEQVRVGDVGGNSLGLFGGRFSPQGDMIVGHGYQGAFHLWKNSKPNTPRNDSTSNTQLGASIDATPTSSSDQSERWIPQPTISGHFEAVQDISWEPKRGEFLISVSTDQTSRLHAPRRRNLTTATDEVTKDGKKISKEAGKIEKKLNWHEIARPQIHGYDMQCIAMIESLMYISGADEKVLRVFRAPQNFVGNLDNISGVNLSVTTKDLPVGASVPSLGLSNKAIFESEGSKTKAEEASSVAKNAFGDNLPIFTPIDLQEPPVEAHLLQNTLWPETQKLYGHGYEVYCVACSPNGKYIASACKASKLEHASIRVWSTSSWRQITTLTLHTLTVTQLAFSHSGQFLLTVSRDRCWSLWKLNNSGSCLEVSLVARTNKTVRSHSRIIWSCSWSCDDTCFVTASRDKKVFLWSRSSCVEDAKDCGKGWRVGCEPLDCDQPVTAVDFAPVKTNDGRHILAVGLENGHISLHTCHTPSHTLSPRNFWSQLLVISHTHCHTSTVKRLKWRPFSQEKRSSVLNKTECQTEEDSTKNDSEHFENVSTEKVGGASLCLASCGTDHFVKIFKITLE